MNASALVSIVIPTYFRNEQLRSAIRSAQRQTYSPIEIIVVDDSGERHAEPVCDDLDVLYLAHEENHGGNPARNTGIEAASGEYIQLLDDDDELAAEKIEKQVELLESSDDIGVVYCGLENADGDRIYPDPNGRGDVYHEALQIDALHPCLTGTMLIRSTVLREIFPLAARRAADDIGMKIRLAEVTEFDFVNEVLYYKGRSDTHRSEGLGFTLEIRNIVVENMSEYESAPERVYREGMCRFYKAEGYLHLEESLWSWEAIRSFWLALRYSDEFNPTLVALFLSSWFGSPGYRVASFLYQQLH